MNDVICVYCGGKWNEETKRMEHTRACYIETGHMTRAVAQRAKEARARKAAEPREPTLDLGDE